MVTTIEPLFIGQIRTGALTAMATSEIIKEKNINFTLIGSGFQAESQFLAMKESAEIIGVRDRNKIVEFKDYIVNKDKYKGNKTIFKSMGVGLEDIAAGYVVLKNMGLFPLYLSLLTI